MHFSLLFLEYFMNNYKEKNKVFFLIVIKYKRNVA